MNIDDLNVKLRIRGLWEAVDLGFLLAKQYFLPLFITWFIGALPVAFILGAIFNESPLWAALGVWFFKPIYENVMLARLSKMIFGQQAPLKPIVKSYTAANKGRLFYSLIVSRLMLNRSFSAPVSLLELQKGAGRKLRLKQLSLSMQNVTQFMTVLLFIVELGLAWAILTYIYMIFPTDFFDHGVVALIENDVIYFWGYTLISIFTMGVIAPFYVCAGFSLYLSRRTQLEGWDIELNFKQLITRIESQNNQRKTVAEPVTEKPVPSRGTASASVLGIVLGCLCLSPILSEDAVASDSVSDVSPVSVLASEENNNSASLTKETAKTAIKDVLSGDEFGSEKTEYRWQKKKSKKNRSKHSDLDLDDFFEFIVSLAKSLALTVKIILVILLLLVLAYVFSHASRFLDGVSGFFNKREDIDVPTHLFGLDMKKSSLPDDVGDQARQLIMAKQHRQALALLLRASFIHVLHKQKVFVPASATEQECLRLFQSQLPDHEFNFLKKLVKQWVLVAYAHETPDTEILSVLCDQWCDIYEGSNASDKNAGSLQGVS